MGLINITVSRLNLSLIAFLALAGCEKYDVGGKFYYPVAENLRSQWIGSSIENFEKRFGPPIDKSTSGKISAAKWEVYKQYLGQRRYEYVAAGTGTLRVFHPGGLETANCKITVSSTNGTITAIRVRSDMEIDSKSLCESHFAK